MWGEGVQEDVTPTRDHWIVEVSSEWNAVRLKDIGWLPRVFAAYAGERVRVVGRQVFVYMPEEKGSR